MKLHSTFCDGLRGPQLKQENEELKAELQVARDQSTSIKETVAATNMPSATKTSIASDEASFEKILLRQELHSLQVSQLGVASIPNIILATLKDPFLNL